MHAQHARNKRTRRLRKACRTVSACHTLLLILLLCCSALRRWHAAACAGAAVQDAAWGSEDSREFESASGSRGNIKTLLACPDGTMLVVFNKGMLERYTEGGRCARHGW